MHNVRSVEVAASNGYAEAMTPEWLGDALHDMAQPLTALQCRLFLATLPVRNGSENRTDELTEALKEALVQCERVMRAVHGMQQKLG